MSLAGTATVSKDRTMIEGLWNRHAEAWFENGIDDPKVALLHFHADTAEYWKIDSPDVVAAIKYAAAMVTGQQPDLGDNEVVELEDAPVEIAPEPHDPCHVTGCFHGVSTCRSPGRPAQSFAAARPRRPSQSGAAGAALVEKSRACHRLRDLRLGRDADAVASDRAGGRVGGGGRAGRGGRAAPVWPRRRSGSAAATSTGAARSTR